jgi:PAS domain S-box-containing protein
MGLRPSARLPARLTVERAVEHTQKPLELILARNLITSISTPAFLVDEGGTLIFYNEAAGALLGMSFEEAGKMHAEQWGTQFGPFDDDGERIPMEELPLTVALREGRPAHSNFRIRSATGVDHDIEVSAMPISASEGPSGAMAIFWPRDNERKGGP